MLYCQMFYPCVYSFWVSLPTGDNSVFLHRCFIYMYIRLYVNVFFRDYVFILKFTLFPLHCWLVISQSLTILLFINKYDKDIAISAFCFMFLKLKLLSEESSLPYFPPPPQKKTPQKNTKIFNNPNPRMKKKKKQ